MTPERRDLAEPLPEPKDRPWQDLATIAETELWIAEHDQELQRYIGHAAHSTGHGICFTLAVGGDLFLHTNGDGDIVLDVPADAAWVTPVISAATGRPAPSAQVWLLPGQLLTQLLLGLNSLIASSRIVLRHDFRGGLRAAPKIPPRSLYKNPGDDD